MKSIQVTDHDKMRNIILLLTFSTAYLGSN